MSPSKILVLCLGTAGDLVMASPAVQRLRAAWPSAKMLGLVGEGLRPFAGMAMSGVEWLSPETDWKTATPPVPPELLAELKARMKDFDADLVLSFAEKPNWLSIQILAWANSARRMVFESFKNEAASSPAMRGIQIKEDGAFAWETVPGGGARSSWERAHDIADRLLAETARRAHPKLLLDAQGTALALPWLAEAGLVPGDYVVCTATDSDVSPLKAWPHDRMTAVVDWLWRDKHLGCVLVGRPGDRSQLEIIGNQCLARKPAIWTTEESQTGMLASLLRHARMYFGQECSAMHLAAALDKPVAGLFGGGSWSGARPAASRSIELHAPLPCYGCAWDCAFVDAPCMRQIPVGAAVSAISDLLTPIAQAGNEVRTQPWPPGFPVDLIAKVAERHGKIREERQRREAELESIRASLAEKERDSSVLRDLIETQARQLQTRQKDAATLRAACDERAELVGQLDREKRQLQKEHTRLLSETAVLRRESNSTVERARLTELRYQKLSPDAGNWALQLEERDKALAEMQARNEALGGDLKRAQETLQERDRSLQNLVAGLGTLELHKYYQQLLRQKGDENFVLQRSLRELKTGRAPALATSRIIPPKLRAWLEMVFWGAKSKVIAPSRAWLRKKLVDEHWMRLGRLRQHHAQHVVWDGALRRFATMPATSTRIGIVTPCLNQAAFLERTLRSALDQGYPGLFYAVQDGASQDGSVDLIRKYAPRLHAWESNRDKALAEAISRGFDKVAASLLPDDVMAWLSADDLLAPGCLAFVGHVFARHPEVDVIYGHSIIIDADDREIGRWIMPRHRREILSAANLLPRETLFWRKRLWDMVGGLDPELHPCLGWDLLLRMQRAGAKIRRLPYFLAARRVHDGQGNAASSEERATNEEARIIRRIHGAALDPIRLETARRSIELRAALCSRLLSLGIRW